MLLMTRPISANWGALFCARAVFMPVMAAAPSTVQAIRRSSRVRRAAGVSRPMRRVVMVLAVARSPGWQLRWLKSVVIGVSP